MKLTFEYILSVVIAHKYAALFPVLVIEGPIATVIAGFLASPQMGYLGVAPLFFVVLFADLAGDLFYYSIGRWGRSSRVFSWAEKKGLTKEKFLKLERHFERHGGKTLVAGKVSHGIGWPTMMAAGITRMNLGRFMTINFSVSIFKSFFLIFLGYYYGENYERIANYIRYSGFFFSLLLLALIFIYFYITNRKKS